MVMDRLTEYTGSWKYRTIERKHDPDETNEFNSRQLVRRSAVSHVNKSTPQFEYARSYNNIQDLERCACPETDSTVCALGRRGGEAHSTSATAWKRYQLPHH